MHSCPVPTQGFIHGGTEARCQRFSSDEFTATFSSGRSWQFPAGMAYYILDCGWQPPSAFIEDVMNCPKPTITTLHSRGVETKNIGYLDQKGVDNISGKWDDSVASFSDFATTLLRQIPELAKQNRSSIPNEELIAKVASRLSNSSSPSRKRPEKANTGFSGLTADFTVERVGNEKDVSLTAYYPETTNTAAFYTNKPHDLPSHLIEHGTSGLNKGKKFIAITLDRHLASRIGARHWQGRDLAQEIATAFQLDTHANPEQFERLRDMVCEVSTSRMMEHYNDIGPSRGRKRMGDMIEIAIAALGGVDVNAGRLSISQDGEAVTSELLFPLKDPQWERKQIIDAINEITGMDSAVYNGACKLPDKDDRQYTIIRVNNAALVRLFQSDKFNDKLDAILQDTPARTSPQKPAAEAPPPGSTSELSERLHHFRLDALDGLRYCPDELRYILNAMGDAINASEPSAKKLTEAVTRLDEYIGRNRGDHNTDELRAIGLLATRALVGSVPEKGTHGAPDIAGREADGRDKDIRK